MSRVTVYSTGLCPMCANTKDLLSKWKIPFKEVRVDQDRQGLKEMLAITDHARTVPQIAIDNRWIGGFMELTELHMEGGLAHLVEE